MAVPLESKEYLTRGECSKYLAQLGYPISRDRLAHLACNGNAGDGPIFHRVKWNRVYYKRVDVEVWLKKNTKRIG
jgi:hypothetical protein